MSHLVHQRFSIDFSYPVRFDRDVFSPENPALAELLTDPRRDGPVRVLTVVDSGVEEAFPGFAHRISVWFAARSERLEQVRPPEIVPGGERIKNDYRRLMGLLDLMLEYHLCRHSVVLAVGGGAMLDAVGFGASLVHRGLRLVRMPSTTLAQNDAGVGVKNGMNLHGGKNTVGAFAPPYAVLNDFALLDGLDDARWRDGVSEAFKVALIKDAGFFRELLALAPALGRRDPAAMERLIVRCAELHLDHIATSGDPFELGSARPLDFGHWSAHKLESLSNYRVSHGHAVAVGIALDALYAARLGWIDEEDAAALIDALRHCGFDLAPPELARREGDGRLAILRGLEEFREHLGGELTLALPAPVGALRDVHEVREEWIEAHVARLAALPCV